MGDNATNAATSSRQSDFDRAGEWVRGTLVGLLVVTALGMGLRQFEVTRSLGAGLLFVTASALTGGLFGFLFGVPRTLAASRGAPPETERDGTTRGRSEPRARFEANTNLEQISDWLTKILVGVGLVQLNKIPSLIAALGVYFAPMLGGGPSAPSVACVTFLLGLLFGFLVGYLGTRLYLPTAFARADAEMSRAEREIDDELNDAAMAAVVASAQGSAGSALESATSPRPEAPSPGEFQAAQRIARAAADADPASIRTRLDELAREYDATRASLPYGAERTRRLEIVVAKMRALALAGYSLLPHYQEGDTPGKRLVAIAMLEMRPDAAAAPWLASRVVQEKAFVGYHAALALRAAASARESAPGDREAVRSAVESTLAALQKGEASQASDSARETVLKSALDALSPRRDPDVRPQAAAGEPGAME